jgi:cardiolipin synthase
VLSSVPDLLSFSRILLGFLLIFSLDRSPAAPMLIVMVAMATDFVDGKIARALGVASRRGLYLDVAADGFFLLGGLGMASFQGWTSPVLPLAIAVALLDLGRQWRRQRPGQAPVRGLADRAGHLAGTVNFFALLLATAVPLGWVSPVWSQGIGLGVAFLNLSPVLLRRLLPSGPRP